MHSAVFDANTTTSASVDTLIETLRGIDEMTMKTHVDKMNLIYSAKLYNVRQIENMSLEELRHIMRVGRIPETLHHKLDGDELRIGVKNVMLGAVEKMSTRELSDHLSHLRWTTVNNQREQMKEALRVWVQHPQCQLFTVKGYQGTLSARHLKPSQLTHFKLFMTAEIERMNCHQLKDALSRRQQSITGTSNDLRARLRAYQEFLILRVFSFQDCRQFLKNVFWSQRVEMLTTDLLRRRCLIYLNFPQVSRYFKMGNQQTSISVGLADTFSKAVSAARHLHTQIQQNSPKAPLERMPDETLEDYGIRVSFSHIPEDVRINRQSILSIAPRLAFDGTTTLWSRLDELEYMTQKTTFWYVVSGVLRRHYRIHVSPELCVNYWNRMARQGLLEPSATALSYEQPRIVDGFEAVINTVLSTRHCFSIIPRPVIEKMEIKDLKLQLERRSQDTCGTVEELRQRLVAFNQWWIQTRMSRDQMISELRNHYWRVPSATPMIKQRALMMFENPLYERHLDSSNSVTPLIHMNPEEREEKRLIVKRAVEKVKAYISAHSNLDSDELFTQSVFLTSDRKPVDDEAIQSVRNAFLDALATVKDRHKDYQVSAKKMLEPMYTLADGKTQPWPLKFHPELLGRVSAWRLLSAWLKHEEGIELSKVTVYRLFTNQLERQRSIRHGSGMRRCSFSLAIVARAKDCVEMMQEQEDFVSFELLPIKTVAELNRMPLDELSKLASRYAIDSQTARSRLVRMLIAAQDLVIQSLPEEILASRLRDVHWDLNKLSGSLAKCYKYWTRYPHCKEPLRDLKRQKDAYWTTEEISKIGSVYTDAIKLWLRMDPSVVKLRPLPNSLVPQTSFPDDFTSLNSQNNSKAAFRVSMPLASELEFKDRVMFWDLMALCAEANGLPNRGASDFKFLFAYYCKQDRAKEVYQVAAGRKKVGRRIRIRSSSPMSVFSHDRTLETALAEDSFDWSRLNGEPNSTSGNI